MDLTIRFTEEKYASKSDVMKDLKTSLVDNIWTNILNYRKQFNVTLPLHSFDGSSYVLCNSQVVVSKNQLLEERYLKLMDELSSLTDEDYNQFEFNCYLSLLKDVASSHQLDNSEFKIRSILKNEIKSNDQLLLKRYVDALNYVKKHLTDNIDLLYFLNLHNLLCGKESGFRTANDNNVANRVVIDRIYTSAPIQLIEPLLLDLCDFINNEQSINSITKSFIAYFYIAMIKPFNEYSLEVASLVAKTIMGKESVGENATLLPYERLLNENEETLAKLNFDAQKYRDLTYFVRFGLDENELLLNELINKLVDFNTHAIKEEFYVPEEEVIELVPETKSEPAPAPVVEEVKVKPEPIKVEEKKEEVIRPQAAYTLPPKEIKRGELAFDMIPEALDEKEAARLEVHLLEIDPSLRKGEARFYARHCTLGKSYTIQQFKKCNGCVYETARTGMEHLVELGYYRKEQIKNKFIYSPINRRNS